MDTLCRIRDLYRSIGEFEAKFQQTYGLSLNEGMLLCSLKSGKCSSGEIAGLLGLSCSNSSKVIKSVEKKELVERELGEKDKRQMYFLLSAKGRHKLDTICCEQIELPALLQTVL